MNLFVTSVLRFTGSKAKTLGMKHLQFTDISASSRLPDEARVVHHKTDELLMQQNSISDGKTTSPV
jgi:hypothetical protein